MPALGAKTDECQDEQQAPIGGDKTGRRWKPVKVQGARLAPE